MTITINDKDIELKYTLRSMMMYENITGKTFAPEGVSDILTFFYCVVVASAKNYELKFDDFLDVIACYDEVGLFATTFINNCGVMNECFHFRRCLNLPRRASHLS